LTNISHWLYNVVMVTDLNLFLGATRRLLSTTEVDGKTARVLVVSREYPAGKSRVWSLVTTLEGIPKWFLPVTGDLNVGGRFQLEGNAGGEVLECHPEESFRITWEFGGGVSWVTVKLTEQEGSTLFVLEHTAHVPEELWSQYGPGAVGIGWEMGLLGMAEHIATGNDNVPAEGMAWVMSDEGKAFTRSCSEAWCQASIASGAPVEEAQAARDRCSAAYTGEM